MKVADIQREGGIYTVTVIPNRFENLFGYKPKTFRLRENGSYYSFGGQNIYIFEDGTKTGNGHYIAEAIDKWRRKF